MSAVIVTCEQCRTQFQLDDAKVPESGIRVRCSRCKCAFFIESPQRRPDDTATDLAQAAVANEPPPDAIAPEEESDWTFDDEVDAVLAPKDAPDDFTVARQAVDDLLGGDWEAPEDPVTGGSSVADAANSEFDVGAFEAANAEAGDTGAATLGEEPPEEDHDPNAVTMDRSMLDLPGTGSDEESGLDLRADSDSAQDFDAASELGSDGLPEADWSPESDWQPQSDWEPGSSAESETMVGPDFESVEAIAESGLGAGAQSSPVSAPNTGAVGEPGEFSDLGNPEHWDFFEGEDAEPGSDGFGSAPIAVHGDDDAATVGVFTGPSEPDIDVSPGDAWFAHGRGALGWLLVIAMCVYAAGVSFFPNFLVPAAAKPPIRIAGFEAARVEGRWVENAVSGSVYVVSGAFHPSGSAAAEPGTMLRVRLLDANGEAVVAESAAVGPPISIVRLRESNPLDLRAGQESRAPSLLHDSLARRKRRPFTAVLGAVPPEAVAFDFQIAAVTVAPAIDAVDPSTALDAHAQAALVEAAHAEVRSPIAETAASPATTANPAEPSPPSGRSQTTELESEPESRAVAASAEESLEVEPPGTAPAAPATDGRP